MAPRTFWKGYLKLSLVTCAVTMTPAVTAAEKVRFRTINAKTGHPVEARFVDAVTGKPVAGKDEVKGFARGEDDYVLLEDEEIEDVGLESTRTIDVETFVPADTIGWIWLDRPHYLNPDDAIGEEAFCVIRDAMVSTDTVGISRLVMYRRERAVMLEPRDNGIVLWTLHYGEEVRDAGDMFDAAATQKPEAGAMRLVRKLIDERTRPFDPDMVADPVQDKLKGIIEARRKGRKKSSRKKTGDEDTPQEAGGNVVNIMDALRKSIESGKKGAKKS